MRNKAESTTVLADSGSERTPAFVTTSWDDGHVLDQKLADLLRRHRLPGTFYVAPENVEFPQQMRLGDRSLATLANEFEIGGHTLRHLRLTTLPDNVAAKEIGEGKDALEQIIGKGVESFCYPGGNYSREHPAMVRDAGFNVARTVRRGVTAISQPYETHTTVNARRHLVDGPAVVRVARGNPSKAFQIYWNWDELAITLFDRVRAAGGVFHLWGHSWEIDQHNDWGRLERVLSYISNRRNVHYIDNSQLAVLAGT